MTDTQRATLCTMQDEIDRLGRAVAQVRVSAGSAQDEADAMAAMDAAKRRMADFMDSLSFNVEGR